MSDAERDAWLAEMWRPCPELSREERAVKRALDAIRTPCSQTVKTGGEKDWGGGVVNGVVGPRNSGPGGMMRAQKKTDRGALRTPNPVLDPPAASNRKEGPW